MNTKSCKTWEAKIYIAGQIEAIEKVCREFTLRKGYCVTIEPLNFVYTGGMESGARIGIIQYPRFEKPIDDHKSLAQELAMLLIENCCQLSCSIVMPDKTIWIYSDKKENSKIT